MTFWGFLSKLVDRAPGWPTERQWVTAALIGTLWIMLQMAVDNPKLWDVKLFEILIQGFALTGMLNMILAFHFAANKADETRTANTGKMADAMKAQADASSVATTTAAAAAGIQIPPPPPSSVPDLTIPPGETATITAGDDERKSE